MVSVTRQTTLFATILLIVTIAAGIVRLHLNPFAPEIAESQFMPQLWVAIISALLLFLSAVLINRAVVKSGIFSGFSTLPVTLFGFISCGILLSPNMLTAAVIAFITALSTMFLMRSMQHLYDKEALFCGMLFLGVLPIIYPPCVTFVAALLVVIFVAPLSFRQIVIATTGYILPFAGASYLNWYLGGEITDVAVNLWQSLIVAAPKIALEPLPLLTAAIALVLLLITIYGIMIGTYNRYTMLVPARKAVQFSIWMLIVGVTTLFALPGCGITIIPAIAVPITVVCAFAIDRMETKWANLFYIVLVVLILLHLILY